MPIAATRRATIGIARIAVQQIAIVAAQGNIYSGLWYPIIIAGITLVVGTLFIKETKDVDIYAGD